MDHSSRKEIVQRKVPGALRFFNFWVDNEKEELTSDEVKLLFEKAFPKQDFNSFYDKLLKENLLFKSTDKLYAPTPLAISISHSSSNKISRYKADELVRNLILKTNAWNSFAYKNSLPSIAGVITWGSYVSSKEKIGDVDISIMFRENEFKTNHDILPFQKTILSSFKKDDLFSLSSYDVEERVISWLEVHPINITGMDNLRAIKQIADTKTSLLFKDKWLVSASDFGKGIKKHEVNDFFFSLPEPVKTFSAKKHP